MLDVLAQQIDHAQRSLARSPVRFQKQRQAFDLTDVAEQGIQGRHIALGNRAFVGIPVADDRLAKTLRELLENWLGSLNQHRGLGRGWAQNWNFGEGRRNRHSLSRQVVAPL